MIDVHTHILPGVDDGLKNKAEVLKIAKKSVRQGVKKIIATPHYVPNKDNLSFQEIKRKINCLQDFLEKQEINLDILPGNEVYITSDLAKYVQQERIKGLNNSRYILLELPMFKVPDYTDSVFYDLQALGYTPIIAHPERYKEIRKNPNLLYKWLNKGVLAQLNAGSLLGMFGLQVKKTAEILVNHNMVQLIGSDLHSVKKRGVCLEDSLVYLEKLVGDQAKKYFIKNAQLVINNQKINIIQPQYYKENKGLLSKFKLFDLG
ncbi:tyrosine-protein phosphatase [Halanaerocella petrolearia]